MSLGSNVFYQRPKAAIDWLEKAFGFELTLLVENDDESQIHAEMTFAGGSVSIGGEWAAWVKSPASLAGANTQQVEIEVTDAIDAHCERARAAGARIVQEPADQFYGARTYRAVDLEGHEWSFAQPTRQVSQTEAEQASGLQFEKWQDRPHQSAVVAQVFYKDPRQAIAWLGDAFGFETLMMVDSGDANIRAHLGSGDNYFAVGNEWIDLDGRRQKRQSPASLKGANTQTTYAYLDGDIDAHCERARAAGAAILQELADQFYGDRTYRAVDLEGHVWSFAKHVRDVTQAEAEQAKPELKIQGWA